MKKEELICEYCKTGISLDDKKCPNCGADCKKAVNEYKKKRQDIEDELNNRKIALVEDTFKTVGKAFKINFISSIVITLIVFVIIIVSFIAVSSQIKKTSKEFDADFSFEENEKKEKKVTVKYNEVADTNSFSLILDSYEVYEHISDKFPDVYNAPDGYKTVAFNFSLTNKKDSSLDLVLKNRISGKADDYNLESSELEVCVFCRAVVGQEKYPALPRSVGGKETVKGYVGYLVPTSAKILKFNVGDLVTIEFDNPVYSEV